MTLYDLECPIRLKVRLVDGRLDVRLLRVLDSTICIGVGWALAVSDNKKLSYRRETARQLPTFRGGV